MVGRSRTDASWHSRESAVSSPREVVVALNAHGGTSEGEPVCRFPAGSFNGHLRKIRLVRVSARGPFTTEGVLDRSNVRSSPGVR